jgi:uncharacterized protein (TIGR02646 family)
MRRLDPPPPPPHLDGEESPGGKERAAAIELYEEKPENAEAKFNFAAYKHPSVRERLLAVFHGKCAYCESYFAHVEPLEVEHYRPKSGYVVDAKLRKPGYYWLAAEWTNLLASCIDCNRPRYQEFEDDDPAVAGKANKFPLPTEKTRATRSDAERRERRLLLHPYFDDPDEHLVFDKDGIVKPKQRKQGGESRMGRMSIETYALQRRALAEERRKHARNVSAIKRRIRNLGLELEDTGSARVQQMLKEEIAALKSTLQPEQPYSAMAGQLVRPFVDRMRNQ